MNPRYLYPACFSRHIATILGFPSKASIPIEQYAVACEEIAILATTVSKFEPVRLHVRHEDIHRAQAILENASKSAASDLKNISLVPSPINHLWVRDTGPVYVRGLHEGEGKTRFAINFGFSEWGKKNNENIQRSATKNVAWPVFTQTELEENASFAGNVIRSDDRPSPVKMISSKICLEGGAVVVDGEGTLLATESSIINDNRNPGISKREIELELRYLLGAEKIIWMPGNKGLDETDVHIDAEVNFIRPGVVVLSRPYAGAPKAWWKVHNEIRDILERSTDAKGRNFTIHILDEPDPEFLGPWAYEDPASNYVNFYFVNGGLIVPQFGHNRRDTEALRLLKDLCPDRIIFGVQARALSWLGGVVHCATQQVINID